MAARRPARVLMAGALLGLAGVATLLGMLVAMIDGGCGLTVLSLAFCSPGGSILESLGPAALLLAVALVARPGSATRLVALGSMVLAFGWLDPIMAGDTLQGWVVLPLLASAPYLLAPPVGDLADPLDLVAWLGVIAFLLAVWAVFSVAGSISWFGGGSVERHELRLLIAAASVLAAGLVGGFLSRREVALTG